MRISTTVLVLLASLGAACGSSSTPTSPPPPPPPPPPAPLVMFTEPGTGFSTQDVRDVQGQIARFDTAGMLVWTDGSRFSGYPVTGNLISATGQFQVRFGTEGGERRAYFTETATGTICDIDVTAGRLNIYPTNVPVPGS